MALYKAEALVLRTRDLGEADRVLTLLTRAEGKVGAVARGVRRPRNRLLGVSQPFVYGRYLLFRGRNLDTVSQGEVVHAFRPLREDLARMAAASYGAELVDLLVEEGDPVEGLFPLVLASWHLLAAGEQPRLALRYLELRLLDLLGYGPHLSGCLACGGAAGPGAVLSPREGGLLCRDCRGRDPGAVAVSPGALETLRALRQVEPARLTVLRPSRHDHAELEGALRPFLQARLDRPVRSWDFLQAVTAQAAGGGLGEGGEDNGGPGWRGGTGS